MGNIYKILCLVVLITLSSCSWCRFWPDPDPEELTCEEKGEMLNVGEVVHAVQHHLAYLRHEKHLRLEDSKIYYDASINTIRMEMTSQDVYEIREARFLIVDLVEGLLAEVNRNPDIAPHLTSFPLTADNLEIYIDFESFHMRYVDPYYVGYLTLENGIVTYDAADFKEPGRNIWNFRREAYPTALQLTVYEREAEKNFKATVEMQTLHLLKKEQYKPVEKDIPRYFSPYKKPTIFDY